MKTMFYETASSSWGSEEIQALHKVIEDGFFTMGKRVAEFEKVFSAYFGKQYGIMVNSGSSANLIAVASLFFKHANPLKPGDEVIVPAISWATTYYPLQQYGLKLKFVDIELDSLNMDCSRLEEALTEKTKMIVGVSVLGNPAKLDVIKKFADEHDLYFMEDNCESMDAELDGQKTGTFGCLNTFSFFFSHHISTMEGGMILTDDRELYELAFSLRNHGQTKGLPDDSVLIDHRLNDFEEAYRFILPGYNVRPTELNAAVGLEQIQKLPELTKQRRENWLYFKELFLDNDRFILQKENGKSSAFSFTLIPVEGSGLQRSAIAMKLKNAGIDCRMITGGNFLRHKVVKYCHFEQVGLMENADLVHKQGFFVGNHPHDLRPQLDCLHKTLSHL